MSKTKDLKVKITADIKNFNTAMMNLDKDVNKATKSLGGISKAGESLKSVGGTMTKAVTLPVAAAAAASVKLYKDFDGSMRGVAATMGISAKEIDSGSQSFEKLKTAAMDAGSKTKFSSTEAAEALNYLALAGYGVDDAIKMMPNVLNLAASGNMELAQASDMVTDTASAMGLSIQETTSLVDTMARTSQMTNTSVAQLGEGLLTVGGTAKNLSGGVNEASAALGVLADNGIKGAEGGTVLRNVILSLTAPTDKAAKAMKQYGINVFDAQGKMRPLNDILGDMDKQIGNMTQQEKINFINTIFNKTDLKGVEALLGGVDGKLVDVDNALKNADGTAKEMADTLNSGLGGALDEMKSALENAGIAAGEALAPIIKDLAKVITELARRFSELSPHTQTFIVAVGLVAAAIGPLLVVIGSLMGGFVLVQGVMAATGLSFVALCTPVLIVVGVIAAVVAAGIFLCQNWDTIKGAASALGDKIKECWENLKTWTSETYNNIVESISTAWENVKTSFTETWNRCSEVVSEAWNWIVEAVTVGLQFIGNLIGLAFDIITLPWQFIWQNCGEYIIQAWEWIKETVSSALDFVSGKIKEGWDKVMSVTQPIWDAITGFISEKWEQLKSWASEKFNAVKDAISQAWETTKSASSQAWGIITGYLSGKWDEIKGKASERFNTIKSTVSSAWDGIKSATSDKWESISSKISGVWDKVKSTVKSGVDKIKSFMNFTWSLPKLKMPHFSISGKFSLNPPSVPNFGIKWYSKGGIFKRPSVLGGIGVGDKHRGNGSNAEAVLPINKLPELLGLDKDGGKGNLSVNIEEFNNNTDADIENLCDRIAFELKRRRVI